MAPLIGAMWIVGAACALYMPSHRKDIIKETLTFIATYNATLLGLTDFYYLWCFITNAYGNIRTATGDCFRKYDSRISSVHALYLCCNDPVWIYRDAGKENPSVQKKCKQTAHNGAAEEYQKCKMNRKNERTPRNKKLGMAL